MKGVVVALLKYCPCMFLQEPRKTTKNLRIVGTLSEIRTGRLLKTSRKYYPLRQLDWSTQCRIFFCPHGASDPGGSEPPHYRGFAITLGRTSQDKWPTGHRELCLTIHDTHNRQTSMTRLGFERILPASEQPQTNALDHTATGIQRHTLESHNSMWFL